MAKAYRAKIPISLLQAMSGRIVAAVIDGAMVVERRVSGGRLCASCWPSGPSDKVVHKSVA